MNPNKDKNTGSKSKQPTFVEWFSKKKKELSDEHPDLSSTDLTKMGMKIYKEIIKENLEKEQTESGSKLVLSEGKKRSLVDEKESNTKKHKECNEL